MSLSGVAKQILASYIDSQSEVRRIDSRGVYGSGAAGGQCDDRAPNATQDTVKPRAWLTATFAVWLEMKFSPEANSQTAFVLKAPIHVVSHEWIYRVYRYRQTPWWGALPASAGRRRKVYRNAVREP